MIHLADLVLFGRTLGKKFRRMIGDIDHTDMMNVAAMGIGSHRRPAMITDMIIGPGGTQGLLLGIHLSSTSLLDQVALVLSWEARRRSICPNDLATNTRNGLGPLPLFSVAVQTVPNQLRRQRGWKRSRLLRQHRMTIRPSF